METTYNLEQNLKKKAITKGVILGVISAVLSIISLYFSATATSIYTSSIINFVVNYGVFLAIAVVFVLQLRRAVGGYWSFSTALKNIFILLAVTATIGLLGISAFNAAFPDLQVEAIENTQNLTIETMEAANTPDEQIDTVLEMLDEQKEALGALSFGQVVKGLFVSLLLYFVLALILAAIFKKEKPIFKKVNPTESGSPDAHPWQNNNNPE